MTRSEYNKKILAVDPSGTGTTGIFFKSESQEQFDCFTSQHWTEHRNYIYSLLKDYQPAVVLYETTNYINSKGKDMTSLLKLLGALESLPGSWAVPVNQVKGLKGKLLKGEQSVAELEYKPGKGWHYNRQKISVHGLDAYLVYWLWQAKEQQNNELIDKSISATKTKLKPKPNIRENE